MSTRCITVFKDENGEEICILYRHSDGYPEGHGLELAEFLRGKKVRRDTQNPKDFNGMAGLTAQTIANFADQYECGNWYVYAPHTYIADAEFIYTISSTNKQINIWVWDCRKNKDIFDGSPEAFLSEFSAKQ